MVVQTSRRTGPYQRRRVGGFSMLELVIVIIILGIVAAIAVPRLSRGSQAAAEAALMQTLTVARKALDLYVAEHGGQLPQAEFITASLTAYSNEAGTVFSGQKTAECYFGPYLRMPPPPLPVGRRKGNFGIADKDGPIVGWIYDEDAGTIRANCDDDEVDAAGVQYNKY